MTIDIKDLIKWFIPCFHILLKHKLSKSWIFVCLFLFINVVSCSKINSELGVSENVDYNLESITKVDVKEIIINNQSEGFTQENIENKKTRSLEGTSIGRTFGGPRIKKLMAGLLPLIFQIGAASTWAVVAALVGVKTLAVTLFILKLLLIAGAVKIGALFGSKGHHHHGWEAPHQKEIHLHIHNGGHPHDVHEEHVPISSWNREGLTTADSRPVYVYEPYNAGPQTISTPYGNYMKVGSNPPLLGPLSTAASS